MAARLLVMFSAARTTSLAAVSAVCLLALGACGAPQEESASPTPPTAGDPQAPSPATAEASSAPASDPASPRPTADCPTLTPVTLALPGSSGARFAGYFAALDRGHFDRACLDVAVITTADAEESLAALTDGRAQMAVASLGEGLRSREAGAPLVNIAQVLQRSGTVEVALASSGIDSPAAFRDKRIGLGGTGSWEVIAATTKAGLDPVADTTFVDGGGINALQSGEVDAAAAQTFDGLPRLIGKPSPAGGSPLTETDLTVISYEADGVGMLPDGLWSRSDFLADSSSSDAAQRFVAASFRGWIDCRDDAASCAALADVTPEEGVDLGTRMVQAVNQLIWPSPLGLGVINPEAQDRTVTIALVTKDLQGGRLLTRAPDDQAITTDYAITADAQLSAEGLNTTG